MRFINCKELSPAFNHALEEQYYLHSDEEYFIIWRNAPCVLLGRYQNACAEVDMEYAQQSGIRLIRRITGGGAVYNDGGNVNFCFITNGHTRFADFETCTAPVIGALRGMSVDAVLSQRNDILVGGRKISGNAQAKKGGRVLHHGTLLHSVDLSVLTKVLRPRPIKFCGKNISSVGARVANIAELLPGRIGPEAFMDSIFNSVFRTYPDARVHTPTAEEARGIARLAREKYGTWAWNIGQAPNYSLTNEKKFAGGIVEASFDVADGKIRSIALSGDFFCENGLEALQNALTGTELRRDAVEKRLACLEAAAFPAGISARDIAEVLFEF